MKFALRALAVAAAVFVLVGGLHPSVHYLVSSLITGGVLAWLTARSRASGAELVGVLAGLYFVLTSLISIPETVVFGYVKLGDAPLFMAEQLAIAFLAAVLAAALFGRTGVVPFEARQLDLGQLVWRVLAGVAVFVAGYMVAGIIIFPFVQSYWHAKPMPPMQATLGLQVLRAMALVATASVVARTLPTRREAQLFLAVAFPALGVFCLRFPADIAAGMPASVAVIHIAEVVPYFALCGLLFGRWFGPGPAKPA